MLGFEGKWKKMENSDFRKWEKECTGVGAMIDTTEKWTRCCEFSPAPVSSGDLASCMTFAIFRDILCTQLEDYLQAVILSWLKGAIKLTERISKWRDRKECVFSSLFWHSESVHFIIWLYTCLPVTCKRIYFSFWKHINSERRHWHLGLQKHSTKRKRVKLFSLCAFWMYPQNRKGKKKTHPKPIKQKRKTKQNGNVKPKAEKNRREWWKFSLWTLFPINECTCILTHPILRKILSRKKYFYRVFFYQGREKGRGARASCRCCSLV